MIYTKSNNMDGPRKWNVEHKSNIKKKILCTDRTIVLFRVFGMLVPLGG